MSARLEDLVTLLAPGPALLAELADALGEPKPTVHRWLGHLVRARRVRTVGGGVYASASAPPDPGPRCSDDVPPPFHRVPPRSTPPQTLETSRPKEPRLTLARAPEEHGVSLSGGAQEETAAAAAFLNARGPGLTPSVLLALLGELQEARRERDALRAELERLRATAQPRVSPREDVASVAVAVDLAGVTDAVAERVLEREAAIAAGRSKAPGSWADWEHGVARELAQKPDQLARVLERRAKRLAKASAPKPASPFELTRRENERRRLERESVLRERAGATS